MNSFLKFNEQIRGQNRFQANGMSERVLQSLDMSSDKNFPKSVSGNSDSFDDRICDDLSEVLLQFLSLKDKKNTRMCVQTVPEDSLSETVYNHFLFISSVKVRNESTK